jgi:hypothetical protein
MIRSADERFRSMLPVPRHESFFENEEFIKRQILNVLTSPANLRRLVFFDARGAETTLKDKSSNTQNATLSLAASSLDPATAGRAKILNFNASGDFWDFEDADDLSFGNGTADSAFSIVSCIKPNSVSGQICAKYDDTTGNLKREYGLMFLSNKIAFRLYDTSANKTLGRTYNTALTADIGSWHTYISTYNGNSNLTGINVYRDGVNVDDTDSGIGAGYVAMESAGAKVGNYYLDASSAKISILPYVGSFIAIIAEELSQTQVTAIDTLLRRYVGVI